jgi:uncharacterized protein (DUF58 family)
MGRLVLLAGLVYGLLLIGLATLNGGMLALALPIIVYLGAALIYAPDVPQLQIMREISADRVQQGAPVAVKLSIRNASSRLEEVLVEDLMPRGLKLIEGQPNKVVLLPPERILELTYTVSGPRGRYEFQQVRVTAADHLGLFRREVLSAAPGGFIVLPQVPKLRQVMIRPLRTRASTGLIPARVGGPGVEFFGVREYQTGDPLRWVNWRVTARYPRRIYSNEFEQERVADVGLVLDARQRHDLQANSDSLFEHAVRATASLADAFLRDGNRVAMLTYGAGLNWLFPGYGRLQRERILQALARVQTGESEIFDSLDYLPTRFFPPHSQIVIISSLCNADLATLIRLRAHGYELLIISPDPIAFERVSAQADATLALGARIAQRERAILLQRLRQAGAQIVDWPVDKPLDQAVLASLGRVPKWARPVR